MSINFPELLVGILLTFPIGYIAYNSKKPRLVIFESANGQPFANKNQVFWLGVKNEPFLHKYLYISGNNAENIRISSTTRELVTLVSSNKKRLKIDTVVNRELFWDEFLETNRLQPFEETTLKSGEVRHFVVLTHNLDTHNLGIGLIKNSNFKIEQQKIKMSIMITNNANIYQKWLVYVERKNKEMSFKIVRPKKNFKQSLHTYKLKLQAKIR